MNNQSSVEDKKSASPRIKNGACYGSGDNLKSSFINGERLLKNSPAHKIYSSISHTKNKLSSFITLFPNFLQDKDLYTFNWLIENIHSLGSYCFLKGNTEDHMFPEELLTFLENRIEEFQEITHDCQDFIIQSRPAYIALDEINNYLRDMEISFVDWYCTIHGKVDIKYLNTLLSLGNSHEVTYLDWHCVFSECIQKPQGKDLRLTKTLNRLSTYMFHLQRFYARINNVPERHWNPCVSEFILP